MESLPVTQTNITITSQAGAPVSPFQAKKIAGSCFDPPLHSRAMTALQSHDVTNFISPTNQKEAPISWGDWLIVQAKKSGEIRKILFKALLRPKSYSDPKTLENRR